MNRKESMNFVDIVEERFNEWEKAYKTVLDLKLSRLRDILAVCESPMEQLFFTHFIERFTDPLCSKWYVFPSPLYSTIKNGDPLYLVSMGFITLRDSERFRLSIYPQYEIMMRTLGLQGREMCGVGDSGKANELHNTYFVPLSRKRELSQARIVEEAQDEGMSGRLRLIGLRTSHSQAGGHGRSHPPP
jgi:hypothetical protein